MSRITEKVRNLFAPPTFEDREKTRQAYWLNLVLWTIVLLMLSIFVYTPFGPLPIQLKALYQGFNAIALICMISSIYLLHKGYIKTINFLLILMLYAGSTYPIITITQTIRSIEIFGYFILIPLAGLLFGKRIMLVVAASALVSLIVLFVLEQIGLLVSPTQPPANFADLIILLASLMMNCGLLLAILSDTEQNADQARQAAAALSLSNQQLQQSQNELQLAKSELELRVEERTAQLSDANIQLEQEMYERKQSEHRFRSLAERSPDFIGILATETNRWSYTNKEGLLGHQIAEIASLDQLMLMVHSEDRSGVQEHWVEMAQKQESVARLEYRFYDTHGVQQWLQSRGTVLTVDNAGKASELLLTLTVITDRKMQEEALREAKEQAETATVAKSEFLANMSHEIRTPMNAVIGMTSLLQDTPLDEEQQDYVDTIDQGGNSLLVIIDEILDFSKIESGKLALVHEPFDLHKCLDDVIDLLTIKAAQKNLELACNIAPRLPSNVVGDESRLRQILVNLVSNAIKFTETGEVVIYADALEEAQDSFRLHLQVKDTGIGIPEAAIPTLFQSFNQVDNSSTRKYGGTGLGLAISKRLCEAMEGTIGVESEEGIGTVFHLRLPMAVQDGLQPDYTLPEQIDFMNKGILFMGAQATNLDIVSRFSRHWGMEIQAAPLGEAFCQRALDQSRIDAVVVDLSIPAADELIWLERLVEKHPNLLLIALISPLDDQAKAHINRLANSTALYKPLKPSALYTLLRNQFKGRADQPSSRAADGKIDSEMGQQFPLKILIAEDNVVNQKVALRILSRLGYEADVVDNGEDAFSSIKQGNYTAILMDLQMPKMDGLETTRKVRRDIQSSKQPHIIALTAAAMELDQQKCVEAGMDGFIAKPIQIDALAMALKAAHRRLTQGMPKLV